MTERTPTTHRPERTARADTGRVVAVLRFLRRRRARATVRDLDDGLAIRDLLDHPALRAVMDDGASFDGGPDDAVSLAWARLMAAGPIRFDHSASAEVAA